MKGERATGFSRAGQLSTSLLDRVTYIFLGCSGFMILFMAFVSTYGALKRYLFLSPDPYAYVGVSVFMLGSAIFSLAGVQTLRKHITVDFVSGYFPKAVREIIVNIMSPIFGLVFCGVITYTSWNEAMFALQSRQHTVAAVEMPTFPFKVMVPILAGLLCLVLIAQILRYLASYKSKGRD